MKTMNLYSIARFNESGNKRAELLSEMAVTLMTTNQQDIDAILKLNVGESHVIAYRSEMGIVKDGARVTRLPDYQQHSIRYDKHAKEYVLVTNGNCVMSHATRESFAQTHSGRNCEYAPSEAIALRPFIENGKVVLAWTYRSVDPCNLEAVKDDSAIKAQFDSVLSKKRSARFVGRI